MTHSTFGLFTLIATFALSATGAHAQSPSDAQKQLLAENVMQADANADSMLSRGEFETLIRLNAADNLGRAATIVRTGRFDTAFGRIDANGDGVVTQAEMQALAQQVRG